MHYREFFNSSKDYEKFITRKWELDRERKKFQKSGCEHKESNLVLAFLSILAIAAIFVFIH